MFKGKSLLLHLACFGNQVHLLNAEILLLLRYGALHSLTCAKDNPLVTPYIESETVAAPADANLIFVPFDNVTFFPAEIIRAQ